MSDFNKEDQAEETKGAAVEAADGTEGDVELSDDQLEDAAGGANILPYIPLIARWLAK